MSLLLSLSSFTAIPGTAKAQPGLLVPGRGADTSAPTAAGQVIMTETATMTVTGVVTSSAVADVATLSGTGTLSSTGLPGIGGRVIRNLITNPSSEITVSGTATNGTLSSSSVQAFSGTKSTLFTYGATAGRSWTSEHVDISDAVVGDKYTASIYCYAPITTTVTGCGFVGYNSVDSGIGTIGTTTQPAITANTWVRLVATTYTVNAFDLSNGLAKIALGLTLPAGSAGDLYYLDAIQITKTSAAVAYFDGTTTDTSTDLYTWDGAPHASISSWVSGTGVGAVLSGAGTLAATGAVPTASPTVRGVLGGFSNASSISITATYPAGIVNGDVAYQVTIQNGTAGALTTPATGWSVVSGPNDNGSTTRSYLLMKICDGTETGTFTQTLSGAQQTSSAGLVVAGGDDAQDVIATPTLFTGVNQFDAPDVIPAAANCLDIMLAGIRYGSNATSGTVAPDAGLTEDTERIQSTAGTVVRFGAWVGHRTLSGQSGVAQGVYTAAGVYNITGQQWGYRIAIPSKTGAAAYTGAATFSGDGSLSTAQVPRPVQTSALSGDGSLTTVQVPRPTQVAALSGDGTLSTTQVPRPTVTVALSGSGTLTSTQVPGPTPTAALSGSGTLATTQVPKPSVAVALSGSGTLTTVGVPTFFATAALTETSTLTTTGVISEIATAALTETSTMTVTGLIPTGATAALIETSTLTVTAVRTVIVAPSYIYNDNFADAIDVSIATTGSTYNSVLTDNTAATSEVGEQGEPFFGSSNAHSLWWKYTPTSSGTATFDTQQSTHATLSADTQVGLWTGSTLAGLTRLTGDDDSGFDSTHGYYNNAISTSLFSYSVTAGTTYYIHVVTYQGRAGVNVMLRVTGPETAAVPPAGGVPLTETSTMTVAGTVAALVAATASLTEVSSFAVIGVREQPAVVAMSETSALTITGVVTEVATVAMSETSTLTVTGVREQPASVAMTESSTLTTTGFITQFPTVSMSETSTLTTTGVIAKVATVSLTETSDLTTTGVISKIATVALTESSTMTVTGVVTTVVTVTTALTGSGTLSSTGAPALAGLATFTGSGTLATTQAPRPTVTVALSGSGTLSTTGAPAVIGLAVLSGSGTLVALRLYAVTTVSWATSASGTGWVNPANAIGSDDSTYATWTSTTPSAVSPPLEVGFSDFATVPSDAINISVRVRVKGYWS